MSDLSRININQKVDSRFESLSSTIRSILENYHAQSQFSGGVVAVSLGDEPILLETVGTLSINSEQLVTPDTYFDLASLTKPFTALTAIVMADQGFINLEEPLEKYFPGMSLGNITFTQLLSHTSGLPASVDREIINNWARMGLSRAEIQQEIINIACSKIQQMPEGASHNVVYSDLGYMLLGILLERLGGQIFKEGRPMKLDELMKCLVLEPLGIEHEVMWGNGPTDLNPTLIMQAAQSAIERDERMLVASGETHDNKAYWLGSIAAHAGLFATVAGVMRFLQSFRSLITNNPRLALQLTSTVGAGVKGDSTLKSFDETTGTQKPISRPEHRSLMFQMTPGDSDAAMAPIYDADYVFGHPGFTGTGMYSFIDPKTKKPINVVILTNATVYEQSGVTLRKDELRQDVLREIFQAVNA